MPTPAPTLFDPPSEAWQPVSPRLTSAVMVSRALSNGVPAVIAALAVWLATRRIDLTAATAAGLLAWTIWRVARSGAWVRSWGYAERGDDLCVVHGLWTRKLTVVPYGRMQLVEVDAGPLLRWRGLAKVRFVTASALASIELPGLTHADALALRDRMITLSDARGAGL